jgi:hypothetical protein
MGNSCECQVITVRSSISALNDEEVWEAARAVASRYPPQTPVHKSREELIDALSADRGAIERGSLRRLCQAKSAELT